MISNPDFKKIDGITEWLRAVPYEVFLYLPMNVLLFR